MEVAAMSLLDLLRDDPIHHPHHPATIPWERDEYGHYYRLLPLHADQLGLEGEGGVYLLWHWGQSPEWIYVGGTDDLAASLDYARNTDLVLEFEPRGGIFVTWAFFKPEYRSGVVNYLKGELSPKIDLVLPQDGLDPQAEAIPVSAPA